MRLYETSLLSDTTDKKADVFLLEARYTNTHTHTSLSITPC